MGEEKNSYRKKTGRPLKAGVKKGYLRVHSKRDSYRLNDHSGTILTKVVRTELKKQRKRNSAFELDKGRNARHQSGQLRFKGNSTGSPKEQMRARCASWSEL